jgi:D-sedoheptulose 7-phosphate isomerase
MKHLIPQIIGESIRVKQQLLESEELQNTLWAVSLRMTDVFRNGGKVLFCGNGGSAADAQHLAAELSGRFYLDREPLFAEALHVNGSYVTAVANDYSYQEIYARMTKAAGRKGDMLIGISTSGNSENVMKALQTARDIGMVTVGMTGSSGGKMKNLCDFLLNVPSNDTPRIQESHILIGHIFCELVEKQMFGK